MACNLTAGRNEVCKESVGGLSYVYFVNWTGSLANATKADLKKVEEILLQLI